MKKILSVLLALALALGCASFALAEDEVVKLTVWVGDNADMEWINSVISMFEASNPFTKYDIQVGIVSESQAKGTVLADLESAADVFVFADDQINELVNAGALAPVDELIAERVKTVNNEGSVAAATVDGTLYAFPLTASNGYFMFYNKAYFTEDDVKSFDKMLEVAAKAGKYVSYDMGSGWYNYAFFKGAGLEMTLGEDGLTNICNWNATDTALTGVQVLEGILAITNNPGFTSQGDAAFVTGIKDGSVIAGVNGTWNANVAAETWGENYAAVKLPTYTVAGKQVQMSSFAGYKFVGVNAFGDNASGDAMILADMMSSYGAQVLRFQLRAEGPANTVAAGSENVLKNPAIAALAAQSGYANAQRVGGKYWDPAAALGSILVNNNPDNTPLQTLLDNAVQGITAAP